MSDPVLPCVVCFGDSLTAGFQSPTREHPHGEATPYGDWVQASLGPAAKVRISGVCGELTGDMVARFRRDVLAHRPFCAVILGGTNDLGWNVSIEEIVRNLVTMYEQTLAGGGIPLPVTVPSIRLEGSDTREGRAWSAGHLARRRHLNGLIQAYATSKQLAFVDLFTETAEADTLELAPHYSNDGLHLTTAGYRLLGERVAQSIARIAPGTGRRVRS